MSLVTYINGNILINFETKYSLYRGISKIYSNFVSPSNKRILMYHNISSSEDQRYDHYTVTLENFIQQLNLLKSLKVEFSYFSEKKNGVSVTFDDGFADNLLTVAPIMESLNIPWTVFIATDLIGRNNWYLSRDQVQQLSRHSKVSIGAHGHTHSPFTALTNRDIEFELKISKTTLEDLIGKEVVSMSFPHGQFSSSILRQVSDAGFENICTSLPGSNNSKKDTYYYRDAIFEFDNLNDFVCKINGGWDWIKLWKEVN